MTLESSTQNNGLGLFDFANHVGKWYGVVGYRGMLDAWRHDKLNEEIQTEIYDESQSDQLEPDYEVTVYSPSWDRGHIPLAEGEHEWHDQITVDNYDRCLKAAHEYMEKNK